MSTHYVHRCALTCFTVAYVSAHSQSGRGGVGVGSAGARVFLRSARAPKSSEPELPIIGVRIPTARLYSNPHLTGRSLRDEGGPSLSRYNPPVGRKQAPERWDKWKEDFIEKHGVHPRRLRNYGLTPEEYRRMWEEQEGLCAICGKEATQIDHDHETGRVRGLLCSRCNYGIGALGDNVRGLRRALRYLKERS